MKSITSTTLVVAGMVMAGPASAAMFSFNVEQVAIGDAPGKLSAWQSGMRHFETETFEDFTGYDGNNESSADRDPNTAVGSFEAGGDAGTGDACVEPCDTTIVKDSADSDSFGRNATDGGSQWLDSNDAVETIWSISADTLPGKQFNRLAFFLIDATDVGATVNVSLANGGSDSFELSGLGDGNVQFVTGSFTDKVSAATLTVQNVNGKTSDGWGIDDASVAVPTPGTLALFGIGLLGLGAAGRRARS